VIALLLRGAFLLFDLFGYFSYNTFGVCFANSKLFAVKEKLEIVSGAASPSAFLAGVLPRRRRGWFALIQVSCTFVNAKVKIQKSK
jgi:hypothetical protein